MSHEHAFANVGAWIAGPRNALNTRLTRLIDMRPVRTSSKTKPSTRTPTKVKRTVSQAPDPVEPIVPTAPIIVIDDNEEHVPKRGRRRNPNFLSFAEAREFIRGEMIPSRSKFEDWWDKNKPKSIPRFPYRVYKDEWKTWNDFLGTDNKFQVKVANKWRSLPDAVAFVHTLHIATSKEWMEWCRETGNLPSDIPARPDLVYNTWRSWSHWLGTTTSQIAQVQQERARTQVFYVIREQGAPSNIVCVGIDPSGLQSIKERWTREKFEIVRLFWYDADRSEQISQVLSNCSSPYQGYERERLVPNLWELVWQLETILDQITKAD